ncbi:aminoglycoside phosphotransferase family protein [Leptospira levettii]|uniref:aminoglycoside phosphotransferase family protein n=1 Tax=Leptospira levettii TaxID=2023178 RepID=UPI00108281FC|nr:aminoglycoside phosphotransferase family protein [Leptospira levettii]MCW7508031.1 phosphotransferase [Leptospira levettii]MCW7519121.1 phosphotransferase [Leptospira levettii]TGK98547.1 phosphotransferase [Leptospira levettii]
MNSSIEQNINKLGVPFAIGRSADLYALPNNQVLKLFFPSANPKEIEAEYENTLEVYRLHTTKMQCYGKVKVGERLGIIFDRLEGISLTKLPDKNPIELFRIANTLANIHFQMHQTKTQKLKDIKEILNECLVGKPLEFLSEEEKKTIREYIKNLPEGNSVLHLDFHPENVIVKDKDRIVIDWMTAAKGNPCADVSFTQLLFTDAELWPGTPKLKILFYTLIRKFILSGYLKAYKHLSGITDSDLNRWRLSSLLLRLGLWDIESERENLKRQIKTWLERGGKL